MSIREQVTLMKADAPFLAASTVQERNAALAAAKKALLEHKDEIFAENARDLAAAKENDIPQSIIKRLRFDEGKLRDVTAGIDQLISLPDPTGRTTLHRELDEGLVLRRVTCPIGVIGVIFEARPDALVQISSLCIKSGNCAVLKGGREAAFTNKILFTLIRDAVVAAGLPAHCLLQVSAHSEIDELLQCDDCVDLLIPRGSNAFVRHIMDNTKIPVMGHADGICHIYVDRDCDPDLAIRVILDAKTQYTAACNAVETLLIHRSIADTFLPRLYAAMKEAGVTLRGTPEVAGKIPVQTLESDQDFIEYLSLKASVKLVGDVDEAIAFINTHGSHHTDSIITRDEQTARRFQTLVDSAGVYHNVSTRFADGFRYGFGAEVGISTGKIHARGPVGLEGLVTYKYLLDGNGQIVGDYASGKSAFHFRDLED